MANRRAPLGNRRMDFGRNDRGPKNFVRNGVSPWQSGGPSGGGTPNLLPLGGGSTEATLALASNLINLLQPRPNPVPSLLDMPIRRDFGHNLGQNLGRYDHGFGPNRMGNQGNFRRTGNYNRAGDRINTNRKAIKPYDGPKPQTKISPKKDADFKAKTQSDDQKPEGDGETSKTEEKKETPKTRFDDVNPQLLNCHICNKSMWDGRSFENHLSGRAHGIMMQKTAESYALTADTMRQEFKIREMKRTRKSGQQPSRDFYCAMCDLYAANGPIHRTTVGHRKLKKYLHPTCTPCHKEMPTRIELDEHRLTAEHLKVMQEKSEVVSKPKPEVMVISTLNMEQSYVRDDRHRWRSDRDKRAAKKPSQDDQDRKEEDKEKQVEPVEESREKAEDGEGTAEDKPEGTEEAKKTVDNENTILDYKEGDDLSNITTDMMPVYSTVRGVGRSFLSEFRCVQCTLCRKLLADDETAEVHLRTWRHHQLFTRLLHDKCGHQLPVNGKRAHSSVEAEDEANCKRLKISAEDGQDNEEDNLSADQNGHQDDADDKEEGDGTKASPEEEINEDELLADDHDSEDVADKEGNENVDGQSKVNMEPTLSEGGSDDWEQSIENILKDEQLLQSTDEDKILMEEEAETEVQEEKVEVQEKPVTPTPTPVKPQQTATPKPATPRASPRGRGRGRRRY